MKDMSNNKSALCTTHHFKNLWCLKLFYPIVDQKFTNMRDEKILKLNPYFSIITFIIALFDTIYQTTLKSSANLNFSWSSTALNLSYIASAMNFIFLILVISIKKSNVQRFINYFNYIIVTIPLFLSRNILFRSDQADSNIYSALLIIEFFIRILWLFFNMILFQEALILNSIIIIFLLIFSSIVMPSKNPLDDYNIPYNLFLIFFTFISYFHTKQLKESFSFNFNLKSKNRWFSNIMENMNSGFLYLKNGKINYMNNILFQKMMKNKEVASIIEDRDTYPTKNETMMNLTSTFLNLNYESKKFEDISNIISDPNVSEKILDVLLCDLKETTEVEMANIKPRRTVKRKETYTNINETNINNYNRHNNGKNTLNTDNTLRDQNNQTFKRVNSLKVSSRFTKAQTNNIHKENLRNNNINNRENFNEDISGIKNNYAESQHINNLNLNEISVGKNSLTNSKIKDSLLFRSNTLQKTGRINSDFYNSQIKFSSKKFLEEMKNIYTSDSKNYINHTLKKSATLNNNQNLSKNNTNFVNLYKANTIAIDTHRNMNARSNLNLNLENNNTYTNLNNTFFNNTILNNINLNEVNKTQTSNKYESLQSSFVLLGYKDLEIEVMDSNLNNQNASNLVNFSNNNLNNSMNTGFEMKKEVINFEVFCRFYTTNSSQVDNVEFIFNDITRAKTTEEKNAEFKIKSLILSKIAHEFKNPLICITELIDQIYDEIDEMKFENGEDSNDSDVSDKSSKKEAVLHTNLPYVKSLSNYLLILVKDLDFFSQSQIGKSATLEMGNADVAEILEFVTQISKGLLKKNNKQNDIEIKVDTHPLVPRNIFTDETKLKQILINLQSNAIKFTNKGSITISISIIGEMLKFEVKDTGPGMRQETKDNLFKPFSKSHDKSNNIGAGLGLSIVLELVSKIGGKLDYNSELGKGTSFIVTIPYKNPYENEAKSEANSLLRNNSMKYISNKNSYKNINNAIEEERYSNCTSNIIKTNIINKSYNSKNNSPFNDHQNFRSKSNSHTDSISESRSVSNINTFVLSNKNWIIPSPKSNSIHKTNTYKNSLLNLNINNSVNNQNSVRTNDSKDTLKVDDVFKKILSSKKLRFKLDKCSTKNFSNILSQFNYGRPNTVTSVNDNASNIFINENASSNNSNMKHRINSMKRKKGKLHRYHSSNSVNNYYINKQYFINSTNNNNINETNPSNIIVSRDEEEFDTDSAKYHIGGKFKKMNGKQSKKNKNNKIDPDSLVFIIADDEPLARQSTIRNFKKAGTKLNAKLTILESEDGVETLYLIYKCIIQGDKIAGIITDETMKIMKGSNTADVIRNLMDTKLDLWIYLVSAYEDKSMINNRNLFDEIFSKPLKLNAAEKIIKTAIKS